MGYRLFRAPIQPRPRASPNVLPVHPDHVVACWALKLERVILYRNDDLEPASEIQSYLISRAR
jgi:hypothetical protein